MCEIVKEPIFQDIQEEQHVTEIESYCTNCEENGTTKLLLTRIPHFKEVIIMSFECPHCHFANNEIQSGSVIQDKGMSITCKIDSKEDLNRQLVKSEYAVIRFKELDLEIPAKKGVLTTVEGIIQSTIEGLSLDQPVRKIMDPDIFSKIDAIIEKLNSYLNLSAIPFTITLDDPSGNSYIENRLFPKDDPKLQIIHYIRSQEQNLGLGLNTDNQNEQEDENVNTDDIMRFPSNCSSCNAPSETRMTMIDIPHFKEVVIMSTSCDTCGYKNNEVKAGGEISPKGKRIELKVQDAEDLSRDILKSETCGLTIPDIELELQSGTLGGRFTTVEGLLQQVHDELGKRLPFLSGDSTEEGTKKSFQKFLDSLSKLIQLEQPFTLILDDPVSNSYVQNIYAPDPDPNMTIEEYERTWEQNEVLGLNDIQVD